MELYTKTRIDLLLSGKEIYGNRLAESGYLLEESPEVNDNCQNQNPSTVSTLMDHDSYFESDPKLKYFFDEYLARFRQLNKAVSENTKNHGVFLQTVYKLRAFVSSQTDSA